MKTTSTLIMLRLLICSNLACKFESDLQDCLDWGRRWLVNLSARKTQLYSLYCSNNAGVLDANLDGPVLDEK